MLKKLFCFTCCLLVLYRLPAQPPRLVLPIGHTERIEEARFSPDGKYFISASEGSVMLWESASGRLLRTIKGNGVGGFTQQGHTIITYQHQSDSTGTIQLTDLYSGNLLDSLDGYSIDFTKTGDYALVSTSHQTIQYRDCKNKKTIFELPGVLGVFLEDENYMLIVTDSRRTEVGVYSKYSYTFNVWDLKAQKIIQTYYGELAGFSNKYICVAEKDQLRIITTLSGNTVQTFSLPEDETIKEKAYKTYRIRFSRDNELMAVYEKFNANQFLLFDTDSFKVKKQFVFPGSRNVEDIVFSPDHKSVIAIDSDTTAIAFSTINYDTLFQLKGHHKRILGLQFSPDKKQILTISSDTKAIFWDAITGVKQKVFEGKNAIPLEAAPSPDGKYFAYFLNNNLLVYETATFQRILSRPMEDVSIAYTPDSRYLLLSRRYFSSSGYPLLSKIDISSGQVVYDFSYSRDSSVYYPSADGSLIAKVKGSNDNRFLAIGTEKEETLFAVRYDKKDLLERVVFSADKKYCIALFTRDEKKDIGQDELVCYSTQDGNINWTYKAAFIDIDFEINEKKRALVIRTGLTDSSFCYVDLESGQSSHLVTTDRRLFKFAFTEKKITFSPDGNIFSFKDSKTIRFYDYAGSRLLLQLDTPSPISFIEYPNEKEVALCNWEGNVETWDLINQKKISTTKIEGFLDAKAGENYIASNRYFLYLYNMNLERRCSFVNLNVDDDITLINGGYYQSSQSASKMLYYVTKDLKTIGFEQLDVKYNRPDKVLEAIGNTDTALIKSYRKAWEKRIRKLGIDTTAFRNGYSVPEADFANRDTIEYEQKKGTLKLHIKGIDSTYKLDRFNLWVNEVPVYGQRGISIRKAKRNDFDTTITIKLSQGENRIETSVTNTNGTESYRIPLQVKYTPAIPVRETTRFIGIGIDQFADSWFNLQYSTKDIRDLAVSLKEKYGSQIIIDTLFNKNVTVSNVKALKKKLLTTNENDKVIIAYSGHGMLSKNYDYYLSTFAVNFRKPEENGLAYEELEDLLDSIPARKKLMLIDACHSGEVDKEDLITLNAAPDSLIKGLKPVAYKQEGRLGLKNSFELMQSLFVNVGKSTGATIISAAAGTQFALERNDLKNGVFTYSILEAMKTAATMKISDLKTIVGKRVEEITKGLQKPTSRNETIAVDWNVW